MSFTIGKNVAVVLVTVRMFGSLNPNSPGLSYGECQQRFFCIFR